MLGRLDQRVLPHLAGALGRLARRRPPIATIVIALLTAAGVIAWGLARPGTPDSVDPQVQVGIRPGDSIPAYARASQAELEQLAGALPTDSAALHDLAGQYAARAELARFEAGAYATRCSCVYALVVRATPAALLRLRQRPEVRIVDPVREVSDVDQTMFVAPL